MTDEQRELMRIAAQSVVAEHEAGRSVDPKRLDWARSVVSQIKPLGRPLSSGEPATETLPPALRGGALEVF